MEPTMTTTTDHYPDVQLPAGATHAENWEPENYRIIHGPDQGITDSDARIWTSAIQWLDGCINNDPEEDEPPRVRIDMPVDLNSDQARELASVLIETAALLDGWAGK
jgi:hypothetical protein